MQHSRVVGGGDKGAQLERRLEAVRRRAREGFAERARELREAADALDGGDPEARAGILRLAHKLRGVAGSAGRADLTERAARLERAARADASDVAIALTARRLADAAEAPPSEPPGSRDAQPRERPPTRPATRSLGWRVVALDDSRSTRRLLEITLRQAAGCEAEVFDSPGAAMRAVREAPPDLLIVDAMMPDMDGLTFYRGVRQRDAALPVVILSAATPEELGWTLPDDPRLRWLRKPFRPGRLIEELRAFVEGE